jgi:GTP-binding protein EngB required for normal cell division
LEFQQKDEIRYKQLNQLGWKVIVFVSKTDKLHDIQDYFQQCLKNNSQLIKIDLDTNKIIFL